MLLDRVSRCDAKEQQKMFFDFQFNIAWMNKIKEKEKITFF